MSGTEDNARTPRRRPFPNFRVDRGIKAWVMATLLVGQQQLLLQAGRYSEVKGLYEIAVLLVLGYAVWPQIQYTLGRLVAALANRVGDADV